MTNGPFLACLGVATFALQNIESSHLLLSKLVATVGICLGGGWSKWGIAGASGATCMYQVAHNQFRQEYS